MSQRYNTKRPKPKENQLRNLKRALGPGETWRGSMSIHLRSCCIFSLKVAATLLSGSLNGAVGA